MLWWYWDESRAGVPRVSHEALESLGNPGHAGLLSELQRRDQPPGPSLSQDIVSSIMKRLRGLEYRNLPAQRPFQRMVENSVADFGETSVTYLTEGYFLNIASAALLISFSRLDGFPSALVDIPSQTPLFLRGSMKFT